MRVDQMREKVKEAYPGKNWKAKVDKMLDEQIIAVYYTLINFGKIKT